MILKTKSSSIAQNAHSVLSELWIAKPETAAKCIQTANQLAQLFMSDRSFAPSTWAYLLAALDCNSFALYREVIMKQVAEICGVDSPTAASQGRKIHVTQRRRIVSG